MGQTWDVFNIDRREKELAGGAKLGEFFWNYKPFLYQSLRVPRLPKAVDQWLSRGTVAVQPGPTAKLSTEVLGMVFEALLDGPDEDPTENFLDCIFFAVCCKRLLSVGKRHILRGLISRHARAADCRLVCLGGYSRRDEQAPPGMLTDAEVKEIATTPGADEDSYPSLGKALAALCLYIFALESYDPYYVVDQRLFEPLKELWRGLCAIRRMKKETINSLYSPLDSDMITELSAAGYYGPEPEYPEGPNVLCNMSKGEYVREDKLVVCEMDGLHVTLIQALLSRTPSPISMYCGEEYIDGLVKGPWAGDRFRITSVEEMPPLKGGKWKDVTKEVNTLLCHLLKLEMPEEDGEDAEVRREALDGEKEAE